LVLTSFPVDLAITRAALIKLHSLEKEDIDSPHLHPEGAECFVIPVRSDLLGKGVIPPPHKQGHLPSFDLGQRNIWPIFKIEWVRMVRKVTSPPGLKANAFWLQG
jgi:hypothetical protein